MTIEFNHITTGQKGLIKHVSAIHVNEKVFEYRLCDQPSFWYRLALSEYDISISNR